jgi:hypothetical protein
MPRHKPRKTSRPKIGPQLSRLLTELQIPYDEAQFVLQAAEYGSFSAGHAPDPVIGAQLVDYYGEQ